MQLREWLKANGKTMAEFAAVISRNQSTVSRICAGQLPDPDTALAIVVATRGSVSSDELLNVPGKYRCVNCKN